MKTIKMIVILIFVLTFCSLFVACKETDTYIVSFDSNGGNAIEPQIVKKNSFAELPTKPSKDGFTFIEWQLNGKCFDFLNPITNDITLVAIYEINVGTEIVLVEFDYQNEQETSVFQIKKGSCANEPLLPVRSGYTFIGWYLDDMKFDFSVPVVEDTILIAKWSKNTMSEPKNTNSNDLMQPTNALVVGEKATIPNTNIANTATTKSECLELTNKYSGRWYLQGYSDVYIVVSKALEYDEMLLEATGIALPASHQTEKPSLPAYTLYPFKYDGYDSFHSGGISFECWDEYIEFYDITFGDNCIYFSDKKFVKFAGTKDKYEGSFCKEALGKWYLRGDSSVVIEITKIGGNETSGDIYGIQTYNLNLTTLSHNKNDYISVTEAKDKDWEECGISVYNGVLTVKKGSTVKTFYKTITDTTIQVPETTQFSNTTTKVFETTTRISETTVLPPEQITQRPTSPLVSDVLIIDDIRTISDQTIDSDIYITSTGVATLSNVTINGNIYCYGKLVLSNCVGKELYGYKYGSMMSCGAYDGTHGYITGGGKYDSIYIKDDALDYAFNKWGKR